MSKTAEAATPKQVAAYGSPTSSPDGGDGQRDSKTAAKEKPARSKSADTLASRPERSLAERYNVERFVPEDVIAWSVRSPLCPRCGCARRECARSWSSS